MWCQWQFVPTRMMVSKLLKGMICDLAMWCRMVSIDTTLLNHRWKDFIEKMLLI